MPVFVNNCITMTFEVDLFPNSMLFIVTVFWGEKRNNWTHCAQQNQKATADEGMNYSTFACHLREAAEAQVLHEPVREYTKSGTSPGLLNPAETQRHWSRRKRLPSSNVTEHHNWGRPPRGNLPERGGQWALEAGLASVHLCGKSPESSLNFHRFSPQWNMDTLNI